jgi:ketosteroid isomerase-like protein
MTGSIDELITRFYDAFSNKPELLDDILTEDWDDVPLSPGQQPGRAGAAWLIQGINMVFTGLQITVDEIADARGADGNGTVAVRATMRGVHTGEFLGVAPTGQPIEIRMHDFHHFTDGRITRSHHLEDWLSLFMQA